VRNRHQEFCYCVIFVLSSTLCALAQSVGATQPTGLSSRATLPPTASAVTFAATSDAATGTALPDAPSAARNDGTSTPEPAAVPDPPVRRGSEGAPAAATGPSLEGVADRHYWAFTGAMFGASVFDAELTQRCQQEKTCSYVPPSLRSRAAMYGIGLPADFAVAYLTYHMKAKHNHLWYVPSALVTGANVYVGIHAYRRLR